MADKDTPFYQDVAGFRLPGIFSPDIFRTALGYKPTSEDFFIVTYPKCGTTWTQQIVTLIFKEGKPVINNWTDLHAYSPFLELVGIEGIEKMKRPCSIKIHLPFDLTPYSPDAKYLYVVRNPKDTVVSFFFHTNCIYYRYECGEFDDYFELFMNGQTDFGDYFDSVLGWYEHRSDDNVLLITYEEMKRDTRNMVKKIARFMGSKYGDMIEDVNILDNVVKYSSVEHMKTIFNKASEIEPKNTETENSNSDGLLAGVKYFSARVEEYEPKKDINNEFIRKGIVGDWRNMLSDDQNRRLDEKIEAKLKGTEIYEYWKSVNCI